MSITIKASCKLCSGIQIQVGFKMHNTFGMEHSNWLLHCAEADWHTALAGGKLRAYVHP